MHNRVIWNCRKPWDIQLSVWGDISQKEEEGIIAGCWVREGVTLKAWHMLPWERWSAVTLITPGRWEAVIQMSKCATKNDKERSRCITNLSLLEPLLMIMTRLALSHWKFIWCWDKQGPQTMHVNIIIGTSSLAIIPILYHSGGHYHCSHWDPSTAAQPHVPEASVWAQKSGCDKIEGCWRILRLFHDCRKTCHQNRSDWNGLFNWVM